MQFRLEEARRDGHDDASIASYLAQRHNFDIDRARADGADDAQIAEFLAARRPLIAGMIRAGYQKLVGNSA